MLLQISVNNTGPTLLYWESHVYLIVLIITLVSPFPFEVNKKNLLSFVHEVYTNKSKIFPPSVPWVHLLYFLQLILLLLMRGASEMGVLASLMSPRWTVSNWCSYLQSVWDWDHQWNWCTHSLHWGLWHLSPGAQTLTKWADGILLCLHALVFQCMGLQSWQSEDRHQTPLAGQ